MTIKNTSVIKLEKYATKDIHDSHTNGDLTVIWRDWDNIIKKTPKMVYVSSVNPGEIKGPHLHKNRTSYFSCIHGKVVFIIQDEDRNFEEIEMDSEKPVLICVPNGIASAHVNVGKELARILVLADIAWRPNDNEMIDVEFSDYNFNKWK
jgi:dTDP-4-dehydrorhamnose 3,5-epimerase-like enzyme